MAEGMFSIYPDSGGVLGSAVKDGLLSSQKKALRDVKNTLKSHPVMGKPAAKLNLENSIHGTGKHHVKDVVAKPQSFALDDSTEEFWDPCECAVTDDGYPYLRSPEEYLCDSDVTYLMRGLTGIWNYNEDSNCSDADVEHLDEPFFPNNHDFDFMDVFTLPTAIDIPLLDLVSPSLLDVEDF